MTASALTHPADSVKVRMYLYGQLEKNVNPTMSLVKHIWQREGLSGFYRGLTATLLRQAIFSTSRFSLNDIFQDALGGRSSLPAHYKFACSAAAGAGAALMSCPADLVLIRMQADGTLPAAQRRGYTHAMNGIRRVFQEEGFQSLYRGLRPLMARSVLCTASQFTTYDVVKRLLIQNGGWDTNSVSTHLTSAIAAGVMSAGVVSPLDVIKSRMMQSSFNADGRVVKSFTSDWQCLKATVATEGVRGLWKGLGPCFIRQCPQIVLMWCIYEQYTKLYNIVRKQ
jgi:hypothetical protein|uniref:Mitochondrial carrier protein n=1 Tax=Eutreptiella gymnastica TaxID=73025 RepID=A0A7S4FXG9_9EUGL